MAKSIHSLRSPIPFKDACFMSLLDLRCSTIILLTSSSPREGARFVLRASFIYSVVTRRADPLEWARKDLNFRPHAYQACALTS
jgi:hypothetical protein